MGKYSCVWVREKCFAPPNWFYSQPVQDAHGHSFALTTLKLLSQMEAVGLVLQKTFSTASVSLISPSAVPSTDPCPACGCSSPALDLCTLPCAAVLLFITSFFALSSACPLMSVLEVLISLADQIVPDVHSSSLFLADSLPPG